LLRRGSCFKNGNGRSLKQLLGELFATQGRLCVVVGGGFVMVW
jgi:hypothetical protein